ncbi:MAG: DUF3617 domain-containing protein [Erythrobacter sp.]|uniref:DUF3617 domain-containing protein n=1 Tax=Erythrobacter sp. TaxID=1042 RepID=UPI0026286512|nr:DUF3617 domain-containing protein [Erythrobacter sp.]MDJ0978732.1 DUF3617 domain-containing protein [Erythrobacter sp.]
MTRLVVVPLLAAFALSACGGGGSSVDADADADGKVTAQEARDAMAEVRREMKPEPGKYATTMTVIDVSMPGAPPEMAQMMGGAMNNTGEFCLTPEMAEQGFEDSLKRGQNEACTIESFTIDDGDVNMAMTCQGQGMGTMSAQLDGTVTPTSSDMTMAMSGSVPELGPIEMTMAFKQERVGACD